MSAKPGDYAFVQVPDGRRGNMAGSHRIGTVTKTARAFISVRPIGPGGPRGPKQWRHAIMRIPKRNVKGYWPKGAKDRSFAALRSIQGDEEE